MESLKRVAIKEGNHSENKNASIGISLAKKQLQTIITWSAALG